MLVLSNMEERSLKAMVRRSGGTSSKGALSFNMQLSTSFAKGIGLTKDNCNLIVAYIY